MKKNVLTSLIIFVGFITVSNVVFAVEPYNTGSVNSEYQQTQQEIKSNFQEQIQQRKQQVEENKQNQVQQRQQLKTQKNEELSLNLQNRIKSTNNKISARADTLLLIANKINERILELSTKTSVDMSDSLALVDQAILLIERTQAKIANLNIAPNMSDTQNLKIEMQSIKTDMQSIIQDLSSARLLLKQSIAVAKQKAIQANTTLPLE